MALATLFMGGALCALFQEPLLGGKALVPAGALRAFPPWASAARGEPADPELAQRALVEQPLRIFRHAQARGGRLPLWNPLLACGVPQLAYWPSAALFPLEVLLSPLDPFYSAGLAAFLKLLLAGAFMLLYLRGLGCGVAAAALGAVCYALSGPMLLHAAGNLTNAALWLPLLFFLVDRARTRPSAWPLFAPALAASALGGDAAATAHAALACGAYFLWRACGQPRALARHGCRFLARRLAAFAAACAAAALLAAPQLLPTLELAAQDSWRRAAGLAGGGTLSVGSLLLYLQPYLAGSPATGFEELGRLLGIPAGEGFGARTGYIGVLGLFLAAAALRFRRDRDAAFHGLLLAASLGCAYGLWPLSWLRAALPAADGPHLLALASFSLAALAGMGLELAAAPVRPAGFKRYARLFAASAGVVAFAAAYLVGSSEFAGELGAAGFVRRQFLIPFAGALLAALVAERQALARLRLIRLVCAGWAALDLLWFGLGANPAVPRWNYYPLTPALAALGEAGPAARAGAVGRALPPNAALAYGFADFRAAGGMALPRYESLGAAGGALTDAGFPPQPDLLGLARVMTPPGWAAPEGWAKLYSGEAEVYAPPGPKPRAVIVLEHEVIRDPARLLSRARSPAFDPHATALFDQEPAQPPEALAAPPLGQETPPSLRLLRDGSDELHFEASSPRQGFLVLFDSWYPGWKAEIDARPVPVLRADYAFRALALPAGRSRARLYFEPESFRLGVLVAAAAALALCVAWLRLRRSESSG